MSLQAITKNKEFSRNNKIRSQVYDRGYDISNRSELNNIDLEIFENGFVGFNNLNESFYQKVSLNLCNYLGYLQYRILFGEQLLL